jgi:flagellum-specific ATP synthase
MSALDQLVRLHGWTLDERRRKVTDLEQLSERLQADLTRLDGDDHNEPIADAVRGILDGHIVLERSIGERGRYPAVNILRSLSRTMPDCNDAEEAALIARARGLLAAYDDMAEMIRLGAYRPGSDARVDEAIRYQPALDAFLRQGKAERADLASGFAQLATLLDGPAA